MIKMCGGEEGTPYLYVPHTVTHIYVYVLDGDSRTTHLWRKHYLDVDIDADLSWI